MACTEVPPKFQTKKNVLDDSRCNDLARGRNQYHIFDPFGSSVVIGSHSARSREMDSHVKGVRLNEFGQPIGQDVPSFTPPDDAKLGLGFQGRLVSLEPLSFHHSEDLYDAFSRNDASLWTYLSFGPFETLESFNENYMKRMCLSGEFIMFAIISMHTGKPLGCAGYLRVFPQHGSVEIGALTFSGALQRTAEATEALYLMIKRCFDLGFRRCEWKCDALNEPSVRAAQRLGFKYEGTFRQATIYKGRNRDTKWFSILDREWPSLDEEFQRWLHKDNFDEAGSQKKRLRCSSVGVNGS